MKKEYPYRLKTFGYARVSTDDQDLALQRKALEAYGVDPCDIIEDHASGGTMKRPGMRNLLRVMRPGDTVVVWKLDRLGRTLTGVIETAENMARQDIQLISLTEKIDTSSAMGRAFFQIALVFAELERAVISERTKAGIAVAKARGVKFGASSWRDDPLRMAKAKEIVEAGVETVTAKEALAMLNAANPKARPLTAEETWRRWVRAGCPGADD